MHALMQHFCRSLTAPHCGHASCFCHLRIPAVISLRWWVDEEMLLEWFSPYGRITDVQVRGDSQGAAINGCAAVTE